jgi:ABC-type uncharacterized transport system permease subunit
VGFSGLFRIGHRRGACIFGVLGVNPLTAYGVMLKGAFGSFFHFSEVVVRAIPLMLTGLAVALAATMLLWNIGCEGQLVWGGICAAGAGLFLAPHLPPFWSCRSRSRPGPPVVPSGP